MTRHPCLSAILVFSVVTVTPVLASDVYLVLGTAIGPDRNICESIRWDGDAIFHNASAGAKTITLLDVSNGPLEPGADRSFTLQAGRTASITNVRHWRPNPDTGGPFVVHLDVPDGVAVESRMEIGISNNCLPPASGPRNGKLSFPVFRSLQPAGVPNVHVGTDLGLLNARNNVAIYNAGTAVAAAHIEVHQGCDDRLLRSMDVTVPPSTMQQFALGASTTSCPEFSFDQTRAWVTYLIVTVDQPSLSLISIIVNDRELVVPYAVSASSP